MTPTPVVTAESVVVQSPNLWSTEIEPETVLMNADSGNYYNLAGTARMIWSRIKSPERVADLCRLLCADYEGDPAAIEAETLAFLQRLLAEGLIAIQ